MTAKCGTCYWNVTIPSCAYSYTALYGENCDEWGPAKEYERGRPRGGRGGLGPTKNLLFFFFHYYHHGKETCLS